MLWHELTFGLGLGLSIGLGLGLVVALVFGLLYVSAVSAEQFRGVPITPRQITRLTYRNASHGLVFGLVAALLGGLLAGFGAGLVSGIPAGLVVGPLVGLASGLAGVALFGLAGPTEVDNSSLGPADVWRHDRNAGLIFLLMLGLVVSLLAALTVTLVPGLASAVSRLSGVLSVVLLVGLVLGLGVTVMAKRVGTTANSPGAATIDTAAALVQLTIRHKIPLRLIAFLEDARSKHLLRTVGPVYQFRHATLQDRLAQANHITSVVGLGQSTDNTRKAIKKLTVSHRIPVIGATVTGDSMNFDIADNKTLLNGFFRVSPTNSDTVAAAARYITEGLRIPLSKVAIVEDAVASDDYVSTLVRAAHTHLGTAHRFPFTSPDINADTQARAESLRGQFGYLNLNLCAAEPEVVYFAGRGTDIGTFVSTWVESGTACGNRPLIVLTGDDGIQAVRDDGVATAVGDPRATVTVRYTGLASPGKWGDCAAGPDFAAEREAYHQFQAAFTGKPSCDAVISPRDNAKRLAYPVADLDNGQAILTHDAAGLAATTARRTGTSALRDPMSQIGVLQGTRCRTIFHGASGTIQFSADRSHYGNPIGAILPILEITKDKTAVTIPPGWSTGGPSPTDGC